MRELKPSHLEEYQAIFTCPICGGRKHPSQLVCDNCASATSREQKLKHHPRWDKIAASLILALHIGAIITSSAYAILELPKDSLLYLSSGILALWFLVNLFLVRVFILSENKQLPDYLYERAYFAPAIFITAVLTCIWRTICTISLGIIGGIHHLITKIVHLFRQH